jgi:hypothetical protein
LLVVFIHLYCILNKFYAIASCGASIISFVNLSSSDLMQRFGHLPIRARTTRFPEKPKKSFVDSTEDSGIFFHPTLKISYPICRLWG